MSKSATAAAPRIDITLIKHNAMYLRLLQIRVLMDDCTRPDAGYERKFAALLHLSRLFYDLHKDGVLKMGETDADIEAFLTDPEMVSAFSEAFLK